MNFINVTGKSILSIEKYMINKSLDYKLSILPEYGIYSIKVSNKGFIFSENFSDDELV